MKRINYSILSLLFVLSVARSFQPQQWAPTSTSSSTINKERANTSLQVSTAVSTSGVVDAHRRVLQDWANRIAPVVNPSSSPSHKSKRKKLSSSSSSSTTTTSSGTNIYEPTETTLTSTPTSSSTTKDLYYQRAKEEWADRYTNLDSLRATFGSNHNKLWGDLDAATARRLYKTLLPKALLELVKVDGIQPQDLAPLAYQARVAAKLYARERCQVPYRVFCQVFDGIRQFKKYGKFQTAGMSYDQIFEKYYDQVRMEETQEQQQQREHSDTDGLTEQDVTAKICLKILERSCVSNENVDRWVLPPPNTQEERDDLMEITQTLENDVRKLLDPTYDLQKETQPQAVLSLRKYRILRLIAKAKQRRRRSHHQQQQHHSSSKINKNVISSSKE